jgi:hypothetical protein
VQGGGQRILNQGTNSFLEIGNGTTTNQSAFIDLVGDTTYTDYGLRIIRGADGANSNSLIENRGTGSLVLSTADAGSISFYTNGINRAVIGSDGIVQITSPSTSQALRSTLLMPLLLLQFLFLQQQEPLVLIVYIYMALLITSSLLPFTTTAT